MAEKSTDKDALKAAQKAAEKAKQERIKQSKPKKEGTVATRVSAAVKKFFKEFIGTCKKIVWPNGKTVIKNSVVVLVTILVIGAAVGLIDLGLTKLFDVSEKGIVALADYVGGDEAEETTVDGSSVLEDLTNLVNGEETTAVEEAEETTVEETTAEEAAEEETAA